MNELFNLCCRIIDVWADALGCTYEELNIYLFVIMQPLIVVIQLIIIVLLWFKYRRYKKLSKLNN